MKHILQSLSALFLITFSLNVDAQQERYLDEIFDDSEIIVQKNITYGLNVDVLKNQQFYDTSYVSANQAQILAEHNEIRDSILAGNAAGLPLAYFQLFSDDPSTILKLTDPQAPWNFLKMDVYMPDTNVDTETERPVMFYVHTGNFLPKAINGGVTGDKEDSAAVELCRQWAKRGFVVVAPNYRSGWNPIAPEQFNRTYTLLNAVYRAILDVKQAVRYTRINGADYKINPNKFAMYGQGSGGYVALAYNTLDSWEETTLSKFSLGQPINVIDTNIVGNIEGVGGLLNFYSYQGAGMVSTDIQAFVNAGGALADISWINGNESPIISIHAVRDAFAPFDTGTVIVSIPNGQLNVVDVNGPNTFMPKVNSLGVNTSLSEINDQFADGRLDDAGIRARSLYGQTFNDIPIISINDPIVLSTELEGLFPIVLPEGQGSPWEWWSETDFEAYYNLLDNIGAPLQASSADILAGASMSNPNDRATSLLYIDTIQMYIMPRLMLAMGIGDISIVGEEVLGNSPKSVLMYPNPAHGSVQFQANGTEIETLEIYDLTGKAVIPQRTVAGNYYYLDLNSFESGMYIVRMQTSNGVQTDRLVVD